MKSYAWHAGGMGGTVELEAPYMGWVSCAAGMVPCDARDMFVPVVSRAKPEPIATRFGPRALRGPNLEIPAHLTHVLVGQILNSGPAQRPNLKA